LLCLSFFTNSSVSQPLTTEVVPTADKRLKQFLSSLNTYTAEFEQSLFNEDGDVLESAAGVVNLMRPGKFHWLYTQPYSQYLISDGKDLWIYDEDLEQVTVSSISSTIEKSPASVLAGDTDLNDNYIITELGNMDGADWVELASADPESQYNSIRIGFNAEELSGMILFDNLGQTTRILFKNGKRNAPIDTALFDFNPPEGVDVIDSRE
jgi:outer membrane lipoprotein carrier protein